MLGALCVGSLVIGDTSRAADAVSDQPQGTLAAQPDQTITTLLHQAEEDIVSGRTLSPQGDSAMDAWVQALETASATSPAGIRAIADFAADLRNRADVERMAGRMTVSTDLIVFAGMASDWLVHAKPVPASQKDASRRVPESHASPGPDVSPASGPAVSAASPARGPALSAAPGASISAAPEPAASAAIGAAAGSAPSGDALASASVSSPSPKDLPNTHAGPAQTGMPPETHAVPAASAPSSATGPKAPAKSIVTSAVDMNAGRPDVAVDKAAPAVATPMPPRALSAPTPQDQSMAEFYANRGDAMIAIKDISAARKFYEYAADAGSARAAVAIAKTYDPNFLAQLRVMGLSPDPTLSEAWYRRAAALGDPNAAAWLRSIGGNAAR
jgi:hypothetical protein